MNFPAWFDLVLCERLTLTLLHFLWQGTVVAVFAAVLNRLLYQAASQSRYQVNVTALIAMACCLPVTFSQVSVPTTVSPPVAPVEITLSQVAPQTDPIPSIREVHVLPSAGGVGGEGPAEPEFSSVGSQTSPPPKLPEYAAEVPERKEEVPSETFTQKLLRCCAPYVTTLYLIGVFCLVLRLVRGAWLSRRLIRTSTAVTELELLARLQTQAALLGLRVLPVMKSCADISVPVVIGLLRPVILLPVSAMSGLSLDQLQAVIAHELAHIRRYDLIVNIVQRVIESLLFFHPAVWWVSRQISYEREQACDELVVRVGHGRAQYADALVRMAELSVQCGHPPVTALAAMGSSKSAFKRRILKVLEGDTSPGIRPGRVAAVMATMVVLLTLAMLFVRGGTFASGSTGTDPELAENTGQNLGVEEAAWREVERLKTGIYGGAAGWLQSTSHYESYNRNLSPPLTPTERAQMRKDLRIERLPPDADLWSVPTEAWPHIGRLESLTELSVVGSDLRGQTRHLAKLKNLRSIRVSNCQLLPGDLAEFAALTNLEEMDVMLSIFEEPSTTHQALVGELSNAETETFRNVLSDPKLQHAVSAAVLTDRAFEKLGSLSQLRVLRLINTVASEQFLKNLSRHPQLQRLEVDLFSIRPESLMVLEQMKELRETAGVPFASAQTLPVICSLPYMEKLDRGAEDLTDAGTVELLKLKGLKLMVLWNAQITDAGLLRLAELPRLESLDVRSVKGITPVGVDQFRALRPDCRVIHLDEDLKQAIPVTKGPPMTRSALQMVESEGTHYNGGDVVLAQIGYTPPVRGAWMNWLDKEASASLEKLPAGKHWLIAKHPWTVFPVELPLAASPLKQQPRAGLPPQKHSSNQYFAKLAVEVDNAGKEFILVEVKNLTDELLSFSELDLLLAAGWDAKESEAHSPLWLKDDLTEVPRIEVAARQTGVFRIDWTEWVRSGVWDPMSGVQNKTGPLLPEQQPGKIWVRIGGPGFGTMPVAVTHPDLLTEELELMLNFPQGFFDSCRLHLQIVPKEGQKLGNGHSMHYQPDSFRQSFNLPPDQVERFEFRLHPYRHLVKFENVSLDPDKRTEPKISVEPISEFQVTRKDSNEETPSPTVPDQFDAPRVELIGLTYDSVPKQDAWQPNGQSMLIPDWVQRLPKLHDDHKGKPAPLYLFEVHGLRAKPSFVHRYQTAVVSGDDEVPEGRPYRMAVLYEDLKSSLILWGEHPAVRLTDEPWGPWRTITKEGQLEGPLDPGTPYPEGYGQVTAHGLRPLTKKPNDPERAANDPVQLGLVLRAPQGYEYDYAVEIESVPKKTGPHPKPYDELFGRAVSGDREDGKERWNFEWEWPVDPENLNHIRLRIRPYRHRFEFQEVAHEQYERPATSAPFKEIYTKLDHDLPKPEGAAVKPPLFDMPVVDAQTNQPVTNGKVTVRWSFGREDLETSVRPLRHVFDLQEEFDLSEQGTFPIRIPAGMENANLQLQTSVHHPDYVIAQSFGVWPITREMAADPTLAKEKLLNRGAIKLKRGYEVSGLVTDALDQPVAGVRVYAAMQMPEYLNMPLHAVTNAQGRYKFRVPSYDEYWLMFVSADRDKSAVKTDNPADITAQAQMNLVAQSIPIREEYGEHPVVKLQSGTRIVGIVHDSTGKPLPNVVVQANGSDSVYTGFPEIMSRVVTDAEGRYELPGQKLGVDVRIARLNSLGGWSEPTRLPADVYLPQFVTDRWGKLREGDEKVFVVDFAPVKAVTLRARAYNAKGQPDDNADIALTGRVPVPGAGPEQRGPEWRRRFQKVPGEVGLYELKVPHGLLAARIDLTNEGLQQPDVDIWTRAVRKGEKSDGLNTSAAWPVLDQDDDTILVGQPAAGLMRRELNLRDEDVKKFVLDTLRMPFKSDPGRGSWQFGAYDEKILLNLHAIPQRELVVRALLKALNTSGELTSDQRRLGLRAAVDDAPNEVLALVITALEVAATEPVERPPHEELDVLQVMGEDGAEALPALIAVLKSRTKSVKDYSFYRPLIVTITRVGPSSTEAMNAIAGEWIYATTDEWKGTSGQTLAVLVYETGRYAELAKPLGPNFVDLLDTRNTSAAIWAAWGLVTTGHDSARGFEELLKHVATGTTADRSQAATALAALGNRSKPYVAKLKAFENDPDSQVAKQVREAIQRIAKDDRIFTHMEIAAKQAATVVEQNSGAWGETLQGLRTRLVLRPLPSNSLLTRRSRVGEPVLISLVVENVSEESKWYDKQHSHPFRNLIVKRLDGSSVEFTNGPISTFGAVEEINPGESVTLFEDEDVADLFNLDQPGRYVITTGDVRADDETNSAGHSGSPLPAAGELVITVEDGPARPLRRLFSKLRQTAPFGSKIALTNTGILIDLPKPEGYKPTGMSRGEDWPAMWVWQQPRRIADNVQARAITELLAQDAHGFWYVRYDPKTIKEAWPNAIEAIRQQVIALAGLAQPKAAIEPADAPPRPILISGFGRSAVGLMQEEKLLIAFYTRGKLAFDPQTVMDQFDAEGAWNLTLRQTTEEEKTHDYRLEYRANRPNIVLVNGRAMPLGLEIKWDDETNRTKGIWCGLTSYGRCQSAGRWHEWFEALANDATKSELNPERQYSWAWYLDNDLWEFESYRTSLEMDDLTNVVIAWDEQHPIQHSDAARAARLRVLADGRVFASSNGREAAQQWQLTPAELNTLVEKLLPLFGDPLPHLKPGDLRLDQGGAHWDAEVESIVLSHAGKTYRVHTRSASRSDKQNPMAIEPPHAGEIRSLLGELVQTAYAFGWGPAWEGLRTRIVAVDMQPTLGQARISIELWNVGSEPQQYRFDPRLAATGLEVIDSKGTARTPIMRYLPCQVPLDEKGKVTERTLAPGEKVALTQELNLGLAYYFEQPGQYKIRFGGLAKKLSLGADGHGYPQSNSLTLDIAEGPRPEIHQIWKLFQELSFLPDKTPASSDLFNDGTVRVWLRERTNCPHCLVTFQDSHDAPRHPYLSQEETVLPCKIHDVLLGKTKLGYAHLQVRELFDTTWPECEQQIKRRLGDQLQPVAELDKPDPQKPWRAKGRVVDGSGKPLPAVTIWVACGEGTLKRTGSAVTDADGRYDFRFGRGIFSIPTPENSESNDWQFAIISAHLDGHFEKNHNQRGDGYMSSKPIELNDTTAKEFGYESLQQWGITADQIALPDKPREVDFVMLPAARVSGTLIGENSQPLKDYSVMLTGDTLPPGSSVIAQVKTDEKGRFEIKDVPTTVPYQFEIRKPTRELAPPWDDSWASPPLVFELPVANDMIANWNDQKLTARKFVLKIAGPGIHGKIAKERAARRREILQPDGADWNVKRDGDGRLIEIDAMVLTVVLSNDEPQPADPPSTVDKTVPVLERLVSLNIQNMPRQVALRKVAEQAGLKLEIDVPSLAEVDYDLDLPVSFLFEDETFSDAMNQVSDLPMLITSGPCLVIEGEILRLTTIAAIGQRRQAATPDWIRELRSQGVHAQMNAKGDVVSLSFGKDALTDALFQRLPELPQLKQLQIDPRCPATAAGLGHLSQLAACPETCLNLVFIDARC